MKIQTKRLKLITSLHQSDDGVGVLVHKSIGDNEITSDMMKLYLKIFKFEFPKSQVSFTKLFHAKGVGFSMNEYHYRFFGLTNELNET